MTLENLNPCPEKCGNSHLQRVSRMLIEDEVLIGGSGV
ncbi:hypothetical protein ACPOL_6912 (plasmid) [Acidisarcina polymorpha]|uniref:Uncharacterized protein n=1 Tax=Acidisarcina polymorpha TaxID=2211140 RepID=A0A2Z5GB21_9BACT|nr:hypothetical protein ACPOL_6912 [Acidisarcina polymorpha]